MRRLLIVLAVVVLLGVAVTVLAPATLVATRVEQASAGSLAVRGVEGTVWRGRGVLTGAGAQLPMAWTIDATPLLHGEVRAQIASFDGRSPMPRADIVASRQMIALRNVDAVVPATLITEALANTKVRGLGIVANGDIAIASPQLDWRPGTIDGHAQVVWRAARLTLPPLAPLDLGDVTATLVADGARLAGPVANQGGDLDIRGDVSVGADRSATVALTLTPRREDAALTRFLSSVGTPSGAGWRLTWQLPPR